MAVIRILIDGYSLLHSWPELAKGHARHSEAARDETLEMAGFIDDEIKGLIGHFDADVASAVALAAALPHFQIVNARAGDREFPFGPILGLGPVTEAIFVRLRLVKKSVAVNDRFARVQEDFLRGTGGHRKNDGEENCDPLNHGPMLKPLA